MFCFILTNSEVSCFWHCSDMIVLSAYIGIGTIYLALLKDLVSIILTIPNLSEMCVHILDGLVAYSWYLINVRPF